MFINVILKIAEFTFNKHYLYTMRGHIKGHVLQGIMISFFFITFASKNTAYICIIVTNVIIAENQECPFKSAPVLKTFPYFFEVHSADPDSAPPK